MSQDNPKDWRELCRKAVEEFDPDKLMDLIIELNKVLDEQVRKRQAIVDEARDAETETESKQFAKFPARRFTQQHTLVYLS